MGEPVLNTLSVPASVARSDKMVLEAAVNGRADALVTFNVRDYGTAAAQFGVAVLLPREAMVRIKQ